MGVFRYSGRFGVVFSGCFLLLLFAPVSVSGVQMYTAFLSFAYTANKRANSGRFRVYLQTYFFRLQNRVHFSPFRLFRLILNNFISVHFTLIRNFVNSELAKHVKKCLQIGQKRLKSKRMLTNDLTFAYYHYIRNVFKRRRYLTY